MKFLIVTQKVDKNDPVLGFFHRWIEEFAKHFDSIVVICLEKGEYKLPPNVSVYSLGKEEKKSKIQYLTCFYKYAWQLRGEYDSVFVHMNQEYIIIGGFLWRILGKKIFLWRNHSYGNLWTRIAIFFSHTVFATSLYSYTARFTKTKIMPAGIDATVFRRGGDFERIPNSILCLGRISPVKNIDLFLEALLVLQKKGIDIQASIVGDPTEEDSGYYKKLKKASAPLENAKVLEFKSAVSPAEVPKLYAVYDICVNLTNKGSFDKTILEAMVSECLILISNRAFAALVPIEYHNLVFFREGDKQDLALKLEKLLTLPAEERLKITKQLREQATRRHGLSVLCDQLITELK